MPKMTPQEIAQIEAVCRMVLLLARARPELTDEQIERAIVDLLNVDF